MDRTLSEVMIAFAMIILVFTALSYAKSPDYQNLIEKKVYEILERQLVYVILNAKLYMSIDNLSSYEKVIIFPKYVSISTIKNFLKTLNHVLSPLDSLRISTIESMSIHHGYGKAFKIRVYNGSLSILEVRNSVKIDKR